MILTRPAIRAALQAGEITIEPYDPARLSPNAYDWRLGDTLRVCAGELDAAAPTAFVEQVIPATGLVLKPEVLYLGVTLEKTLIGASFRIGRLLALSRIVYWSRCASTYALEIRETSLKEGGLRPGSTALPP